MEPKQYAYASLQQFADRLLTKAGMDAAMAGIVTEVLLEADLLGKTTHGLQLLSPYLKSMAAGQMTLSGRLQVVKESSSTLTLDGNYLPGPYVMKEAIKLAAAKVKTAGVVTVVIRRSHHIACLQAYLKPVTDLSYVILLMCSDPSTASVAAQGGVIPVVTPNPWAVGIPTEGDPILIDTSAASVTNGQSMRLHSEGKTFSSNCLQTAQGEPTNDPAVLFAEPKGTILPVGGHEFGHKGFALAILVEALTSALGGFGRADQPKQWSASIFLQLIDPEFFGGGNRFRRETEWFSQACRDSQPRAGRSSVRMPGDKALALRNNQLQEGVTLHPAILPSLQKWAEKHGVPLPQPLE